ncbi:MAG: SURF1 family protein [Actinomycetota bacterium]
MRRLLAPRWLIAHAVVLVVCIGCVVAGFWQLDRLQQRRTTNAVHEARFQDEPLPISRLVDLSGGDVQSLEYRRAEATGIFDPSRELLVRSQVFGGQAGFDVVTPLVLDEGGTVLVNRGWVPLEFDETPVTAAPPPEGRTTVEGVVRPSQERGALSRQDQADDRVVSRIDLDLLEGVVADDLLGVYLEVTGSQDATQLPVPASAPDFSDEGPHLNYAIQWFSFAAVGAIGYGFLLRRGVRRGSGGQVRHRLDAGQPEEIGPR